LTYLSTRRGESLQDEEFFKKTIYDSDILDGLETLFQQYVQSNDMKKLARIRIEDRNAFNAFTILCLRHTVGVMTWKLRHRNTRISDIFSVSDEALALVILENNALIWRNKAYGINATDTTPRYMKRAKDGNVRKEWSDEGKRCFNDIFLQVRELRSFSLSETNEKELMLLWNQPSRLNRVTVNTPQHDNRDIIDEHENVQFMYEG